jgi:hypothetical protein
MDKDIKVLEQELADRLEAVEIQRAKDAEEFEQKKKERAKQLAEAIVAQQRAHDEKVAARVAAEQAQKEQWAAWEKAERERKEAEEREHLRLEAERREKEAKLKELREQMIQLEFAEEQRRKALEQSLPPVIVQEELIDGPNGLTPPTSKMSDHLKRILRQDRDFQCLRRLKGTADLYQRTMFSRLPHRRRIPV